MTGRNAGDADLTNGEPDAPAPVPLVRNRRSTLGGLKALLSKPLSEDLRRRHQRVFVVAELLLERLDLSQEEIEAMVDQDHPELRL